ncbi:TetR/AcrR family transcriptional regulator [Streptomyces sp. SID13031]|uniref:TetR/AcrR family transcriptional regulator n=1 Tax=Streptomyces sp. SID13031 TaxID=2706046 RepID=UPI0013CB2A64|nr:TetR/AcrR family transcriptional regulator [Streptomyces sp. SID13031]NEA34944.1 TetR/AcrR family transcriptional regulator [Streptomyces sp. SID13031]
MTGAARLTRKGRATKERIVSAAADLIYEHGVAGTSIEDVRAAAGVSGSQMTHYFQDKRSLVADVVDHQAKVVMELQRSPVGALDSFAALRAWAAVHVQHQLDNHCEGGCRLGSLAGEVVETDLLARARLALGFEQWEQLLREGLQAMYDRGDLRSAADPEKLAMALLAALQGGTLLTQTKREVAPLVAALDSMLTYVESFATDPAAVGRGGRDG